MVGQRWNGLRWISAEYAASMADANSVHQGLTSARSKMENLRKNFLTLRMLGSAILYLNMPMKRCNPVNVKTK